MCSVNDAKRKACDDAIANYRNELTNETTKLENLEKARGETQELVNEAQCAVDNLKNCSFGGTKILDSVKLSQQGYQERIDYYDQYIINCKNAINDIKLDIRNKIFERNNIPINCGACFECVPPEE